MKIRLNLRFICNQNSIFITSLFLFWYMSFYHITLFNCHHSIECDVQSSDTVVHFQLYWTSHWNIYSLWQCLLQRALLQRYSVYVPIKWAIWFPLEIFFSYTYKLHDRFSSYLNTELKLIVHHHPQLSVEDS